MNVVTQAFACLAVTALAIIVASGWGILGAFLLAGKAPPRLANLPFLGLAILSTLLLPTWHLLAPIDLRALILVVAGGGIGWVFLRDRGLPRPVRPLAIVVLVPIVLFGALTTLRPTNSFDTAAYHLPVVQWLRQYAIVTGLGNLDPHFGLNNSSLLLAALWSHIGLPHWIGCVNFAFFVLLALLIITDVFPSRDGEGSLAPALLLFPAIFLIALPPSPDLSTEAASFFAVAAAALFLLRASRSQHPDEAQWDARTAALLAVMALTFKVNTAPLAAAIAVAAAILLHELSRPSTTRRRELGLAAVGLGAVLIWCVRTTLLTGYAIFPSTWLAMPVGWRVPIRHAGFLAWWARRHAWYGAGEAASRWTAWTRNELAAGPFEIWLPVILLLGGLIALTVRRHGPRAAAMSPRLALALGATTAVIAWAILAPSRRFAVIPLWTAAFVAWAAADGRWRWRSSRSWGLVLVFGFAAAPLALTILFAVRHLARLPDARTLARSVGLTDEATCELRAIYQPRLQQVRACSALAVWTGGGGVYGQILPVDAWQDSVPWDAAPPASRWILPGLCMRPCGFPSPGFFNSLSDEGWAQRAAAIEQDLLSGRFTRNQIAKALVVAPQYLELLHAPPTTPRSISSGGRGRGSAP